MQLQPTRAFPTQPSQAVQGSKGPFFLLVVTLVSRSKGAGHLFHGRKGRQIQEPLFEMALLACSELSLPCPVLPCSILTVFCYYSTLFYSILTLP